MSYATVEELRGYLKQVSSSAEQDDLLETILARATSIIDGVLGFSFADYPASPMVQTIFSDGTEYLTLPLCDSSTVSNVTYDNVVITGYLVRVVRKRAYLYRLPGWPVGQMSVTAKWGYGPAPASVTEVCLELAVNIWRSKDRGLFTDVIGVETGSAGAIGNTGAVVGYAGALTNQQKMILNGIKRDYEAVSF